MPAESGDSNDRSLHSFVGGATLKPAELESLLEKIARLRARFSDGQGTSTQSWKVETEAGRKEQVTLAGAKDLVHLQDDLESAFVWIWSVKDHMKRYARSRGQGDKWIEQEADASRALAICADIANRLKHGGDFSTKFPSRSLAKPCLGTVSVTIPQSAIASISIGADWTATTVQNPHQLSYSMPILDEAGRTIGDAFAVLEAAVRTWEAVLLRIEATP